MRKTRKQSQKEIIKKAYLEYWKLQNNPKYIAFYNEEKKSFLKHPYFQDDDSHGMVLVRFKEYGADMFELINPYKKIDWGNFEKMEEFDDQIISQLMTDWNKKINPVETLHPSLNSPLRNESYLYVRIDIRADKKEIVEYLLKEIDYACKARGVLGKKKRDPLNKFHLYAQVWDMRKGFPKRSFKEIALKLGQKTTTVISRFKRAYELLYDKPYEPYSSNLILRQFSSPKTCKDCPEKPMCEKTGVLCSDILLQLEEFEIKQHHKLPRMIEDKEGRRKSDYEIALDQIAYQDWLNNNN